MPSDNEIMVLIYETVQKQLNQIKDSRVVMQNLSTKVTELDRTIKEISVKTGDIANRLDSLETRFEAVRQSSEKGLNSVNGTNGRLKDTVDAMRSTLDKVTNPSIATVSRNSSALKESARELKNVHMRVMDEFEQYELRLVRLEDSIDKMLKKQLLNMKHDEEKAEPDNEE